MNARMIGLEETRDLGFREYRNGELTLVNWLTKSQLMQTSVFSL